MIRQEKKTEKVSIGYQVMYFVKALIGS